MMMDKEDCEYLDFDINISIYSIEEDTLYCTLEDIACFGEPKKVKL